MSIRETAPTGWRWLRFLRRVLAWSTLVTTLLLIIALGLRSWLLPLFTTGHFGLLPLSEVRIGGSAKLIEDYYAVEFIDGRTVAIGEPRYWQKNYAN